MIILIYKKIEAVFFLILLKIVNALTSIFSVMVEVVPRNCENSRNRVITIIVLVEEKKYLRNRLFGGIYYLSTKIIKR